MYYVSNNVFLFFHVGPGRCWDLNGYGFDVLLCTGIAHNGTQVEASSKRYTVLLSEVRLHNCTIYTFARIFAVNMYITIYRTYSL